MTKRYDGPKLRGIGAGRVAEVFMGLSIVWLLIGTVSDGIQIALALKVLAERYNPMEVVASDARVSTIGVLQYVMIAVTGSAFATWFYRAHKSLDILGGKDTTYHSTWAVLGFFFPFLNIVRPAQVFREIWYGSDPKVLESFTDEVAEVRSKPQEMPAKIGWWGLFIASFVTTNVASRVLHAGEQSLKGVIILSVVFVLSKVMLICSAVLAIALIDQVVRWQPLRLEIMKRRLDTEKPTETALGIES